MRLVDMIRLVLHDAIYFLAGVGAVAIKELVIRHHAHKA